MAVKKIAPNCAKCNDTGVNETGNNDLPCVCPLGDLALFNTAWVSDKMNPVPGWWLKKYPRYPEY